VNQCGAYKTAIISSPIACFALVNQIYFSTSSFKYLAQSENLIEVLNVDRLEQFLGFAMGQFTIVVIFLLVFKSAFCNTSVFQGLLFRNKNVILFIGAAIAVFNIIIKIQMLSVGYGSTYTESEFTKLRLRADQDSIWINTIEITDQMVWLTSFFGLFISRMDKKLARSMVYIGFLVVTFVLSVYISRSRLLFLMFILIGLLVYQSLNITRGIRYVVLLSVVAPFTLLLSPMATHLLKRENLDGERYFETVVNSSYRADLTDFAYSICKRTEFINFNFSMIANGILNAVPSVLMPSKRNIINDRYAISLEEFGFISRNAEGQELIDYQDSYFSAGVMCLGSVGFLILPFIIVALINKINSVACGSVLFKNSQIVISPIVLMFLRLEVEYANIIINARNAVQATVMLSVLWWLACRFKLPFTNIRKSS
jgi:hypothetical protein